MESHGLVSEPYHERQGRRACSRLAAALAVGGARGRVRWAAATGSSRRCRGRRCWPARRCTRFGIFQAGLQSADDPKYTLQPQRERLNAKQA